MSDEPTASAAPRSVRARVGWALIGIAALGVILSFAISSDEDAAAREQREGAATPVAVAPVERATITERGRYPGELDADTADVASFYPGRVRAVHVRVGDVVAADQALAEIDPVDAREQIARARAQADAAKAEEKRASIEREEARIQLQRMDTYRDQVSDADYDAQKARVQAFDAAVSTASARGAEASAGLRLLQKRIVESVIRAPFGGRIAERHVDPGVIVAAGAPLVRVVATSPLRVRFQVPEREVIGLEVGTPLLVATQAAADAAAGAPARITGVGAEVDRQQRVATVEAVIDTPPAGWLPGMYAEAIVDRRTIADARVVPSSAVLSRLQPGGQIADGVLVADGETARWVSVRVIAREGDRVAVEGEIEVGARALVGGHVDLTDGARIEVTAGGGAAEAPR